MTAPALLSSETPDIVLPRHASPMSNQPATAMTVNEAAAYMNCSRWTIYRLVRVGDLRPLHVGQRLRFRAEDLDAYMERRPA